MKDHRAFGTGLDSRSFGPIRRRLKRLYHWLRPSSVGGPKVLFIVGCQRSGTTLLQDLLDRDWGTRIYPERSPLTSDDREHGIRLNALPRVRDEISRQSARVVAIKALVETQRTLELLAAFPTSRVVFLYRNFEDVINSDLKIFGKENGFRNIEPITKAASGNWRSELLPESLRNEIISKSSQGISPVDAAALFWWVRNSWYFVLGLDSRRDVTLCRYEDLVARPEAEVDRIYGLLDSDRNSAGKTRKVRSQSRDTNIKLSISPPIADLCRELLSKLDAARDNETGCSPRDVPSSGVCDA